MSTVTAGAATLRQLHEALGPGIFEVLTAPDGVDVPLRDVRLYDPLEPARDEDGGGTLYLAVGSSPGDGAVPAIMQALVGSGAAGVAGRLGTTLPSELLRLSDETGLAIVSLADSVGWSDFYELVSATVALPDLGQEASPVRARDLAAGDLFAIAEATAAIAGGPILIDDIRSRVLAFSAGGDTDHERRFTILNRRPPDDCLAAMRQEGVIDHLLTSDEVLRFDYGKSSQPRRAIAIRHNRRWLGSIWLMGEEESLSPEADDALRRAAPVAALFLKRQQLHDDIERRMRGQSLRTLLRGGEVPAAALQRLDLPIDEPLVVIAIEATVKGADSPAAVGARLIDLLTMQLRAYKRPAVAATLDDRVYVLTSSRGPRDRTALRAIAGECRIHAAKVLSLDLRAGIGHEVGSPAELAVARRSADDCLALAPAAEPEVLFEDVHGKVLLADIEGLASDWRGGHSAALTVLIEHDELHHTDYLPTLRSAIDNFGNAAKVAEEMHLHVNTVRHRLRRITALTGIDLSDGDARLPIEIELRAYFARVGGG